MTDAERKRIIELADRLTEAAIHHFNDPDFDDDGSREIHARKQFTDYLNKLVVASR